jgi:hypothetical protein
MMVYPRSWEDALKLSSRVEDLDSWYTVGMKMRGCPSAHRKEEMSSETRPIPSTWKRKKGHCLQRG